MSGAMHRRVLLEADGMRVNAALEDDFHHFALWLDHDGRRVTKIEGRALRNPWTSCPSAAGQLEQLVGCPLSARPLDGAGHIDAKQQCTHQYDLALMALAQAARGGRREYLATVTDPVDGRSSAVLARDGQPCLHWTMDGSVIVEGSHLLGENLRKLDMVALGAGDPDLAEAVMLLRRTVMVGGGRAIDFDQFASLEVFGHMTGACYAFQPERLAEGKRKVGSVRDFTGRTAQLLRQV